MSMLSAFAKFLIAIGLGAFVAAVWAFWAISDVFKRPQIDG